MIDQIFEWIDGWYYEHRVLKLKSRIAKNQAKLGVKRSFSRIAGGSPSWHDYEINELEYLEGQLASDKVKLEYLLNGL